MRKIKYNSTKRFNKGFLFCIAMLMFNCLLAFGQSASVVKHEDTCPGEDGGGIIKAYLPEATGYSASLDPGSAGTKEGKTVTFKGLSAGTYKVTITADFCPDIPMFTTTLTVDKKDECTIPVSISIISSWTCQDPTTKLKATASGGTAPYSYSWGSDETSTSQTGRVSVSVSATDAEGRSGSGELTFYVGEVQCSVDPNEISGPLGYSEKQMVAKKDRMEYTIMYENDPDFATAPASRVKIVYPVRDEHNINSFRISDFGFGSFIFTVPQNATSYYKRLDVSDSLNVWVDVTAGIDITKREVFWIFQSIDPATGVEPVDAQMGYLPINDKSIGNGEGYVNFSILPNSEIKTGDEVLADASIVFDDNAAIPTNVWSNIIDALAPVSTLKTEVVNSSELLFSFSGQDDKDGSGIKDYKLYISVNEKPYEVYGTYKVDQTCSFSVGENNKYKFYVLAEDNVGNIETEKSESEFEFGEIFYRIITDSNIADGGTTTGAGKYRHDDEVVIKAEPNAEYVFVNWTLNSKVVSSDAEMTFVAKESGVYVANFLAKCDLTVTSYPAEAGACIGSATYVYGDTVHVKATPNIGYRFVSWTKQSEVIGNADKHEFVIYNHTKLIANFEALSAKIEEISAQICFGETYQFDGKKLTDSGVYTKMLQTEAGLDSMVVLTLTVLPEVYVDLGGNIIVENYQNVLIDAGDGFASYLWSTGETTQSIIIENPEELNEISVQVEVTTSDGCSGTDIILITYDKPNDIEDEVQDQEIKVYPNPTKGEINILFGYIKQRNIKLYDLKGKLLHNSNHEEKLVKLDFGHIVDGTYIMRIDNSKVVKIIIAK